MPHSAYSTYVSGLGFAFPTIRYSKGYLETQRWGARSAEPPARIHYGLDLPISGK